MKEETIKHKFIQLRAQGLSFEKIARELKVSKQTLINWSKALKHDIANLKAIELEVLQEQYYLTKRKRIELLGEKLKCIKNELDKRELDNISTDKLIDYFIKYYKLLQEEHIPLIFEETEDLGLNIIDFSTTKTWHV